VRHKDILYTNLSPNGQIDMEGEMILYVIGGPC
jgi:hypothetical protein